MNGFAGGTATGLLSGESFGDALALGAKGALFGGAVGGLVGTAQGIRYAKANNLNAWNGNAKIDRAIGAAKKGFSKNSIPKGFKQAKEFGYQHGQKVYEYKGRYYSRDIDMHNGGIWKVFERRGNRLFRIGTADEFLNIFRK